MKGLVVAAAALAALVACAPGFRSEDAADFAAHATRPGAFLLDVRTPDEYAAGRLVGARLIPVQELEARFSELPADKGAAIHVYCASGRRSERAARMLEGKGYRAVHDLKGGIASWEAAGRPVERAVK